MLLSQAHPLPSPVREGATGALAPGFQLHFPFWHLFFTPFCSIADALTAFSVHQDIVLIAYVFAGCFLILRFKRGCLAFLIFVAYIAWGALVPRPMGRLAAADPDILLIDFHSHTSYSHDGRPMFIPSRNMEWHRLQGYGAGFITDHNRVEGTEQAKAFSRDNWTSTGYRSLEGEEISLWRTHLVLLGNHARVDNRPYDTGWPAVGRFIKDMHQQGLPVIASLPEYWEYHWGAGVQDLVKWGIDGFEIINSAPKALDFPSADRLQIIDLCRRQNLFMTGISDNHGYGYATDAWNAVRLPGWQAMDPDTLEKAVLAHLKKEGFKAVQVLERMKYFPNNDMELALSPLLDLAVYWRLLQPLQVLFWIAWIWLSYLGMITIHGMDR